MVKRKSFADWPCPVARALDAVGDRWSLLIVRDVFDGIRRFGELEASLRVARNILTDRLKTLVEQGILKMVPASDGTAYCEYVLTEKGEKLFPVIVSLRQWGESHLYARGEKHSVLVERSTGKRVRPLELRFHDGRLLRPSDTVVRNVPRNT
jgi:DNA-binding HxlR family transcriptional regulator